MDVLVHTGLVIGRLELRRGRPGQEHLHVGRLGLDTAGHGGHQLGIGVIGGADDGHVRTGSDRRVHRRLRGGEAVVADHVEMGHLHEGSGEVRPCLVLGDGAHVAEEHLHVVAGPGDVVLGGLAEGLILLGPAVGLDGGEFFALAVGEGSGDIGEGRALLEGVAGAHGAVDALEGLARGLRGLGGLDPFQWLLGHIGVHVAAHGPILPGGQPLEPVGQGGGDLRLDGAGAEGFQHAAGSLDLLDLLPDGFAQLAGQGLHVPGAARRVHGREQIELLLHHHLDVPGDAAGETVAVANGRVEGQHLHAADAAHHAGEGLGGGAKDVHVGIIEGGGKLGGLGEHVDGLGLLAGAVGLHELSPHHADGPELGDLHEEVGAKAEVEADVLGYLIHREALFHQGVDIAEGGRESRGGLLDGVGAAVVVDGALDVDDLQFGGHLQGALQGLGHLLHVAIKAAVEAALLHGLAHGVGAYAAGEGRVVAHLVLAAEDGGEEGQGGGACVDGQGGVPELDLIEEGLHVAERVELHGLGVEVHGAGALVELLQQDLVGLLGVMGLHLLGDLPGFLGVACGLGAPEEVGGAGESQALLVGGGLGLGIDGRERDALRRFGEQLLLENAALQAFDGRGLPGLVGRGREFIEGHRSQRFGVRFGIHHNILSSIIYHYRRGWSPDFPADTAATVDAPEETPKRTHWVVSACALTPGSAFPDDAIPPRGGPPPFCGKYSGSWLSPRARLPTMVRSGDCALAAIDSSGTAPDSHRIPCKRKTVCFFTIMLPVPAVKVNCFSRRGVRIDTGAKPTYNLHISCLRGRRDELSKPAVLSGGDRGDERDPRGAAAPHLRAGPVPADREVGN